jgi:hypothetical protein
MIFGLGVLLLAVSLVFLLLALFGSGSGLISEVTDFDSERNPSSLVSHLNVEKDWPREIELTESQTVRLALFPGSVGGDDVLASESSDASRVLKLDLEDDYEFTSASATLEAANFDVRPMGAIPQSVKGQDSLEWAWNLGPRHEGRQVLTARIEAEFVSVERGETRTEVWIEDLEVRVSDPESFLAKVPILSVVTGFLGSALSIPFGFTVWKEWRGIRKSRGEGDKRKKAGTSSGRTGKVGRR